jgi:hypothetical protein
MHKLAWLLLGATPLPAQQVLQNLSAFDFYSSYASMGDVDGDGYEDAMVTSAMVPSWWTTMFDYQLRVYSGRDASLLRTGPFWPVPDGGRAITHGDHDGDGIRDYICMESHTATSTRRLSVRSGRDDSPFWTVQQPSNMYWAYHILGDLDIDGDGKLDVIVSHPTGPGNLPSGALWAYDHHGNLLYHLAGAGPNYSLAQSLAKLGDVNNDGCDDYLCGLGDPTWYGAVAVMSGPTGQILRIVTGQNYLDYIGTACVGLGDIDGDNIPDFASGGGLGGSFGSVQAFSGATGARLFAVYSGLMSDRFGAVLQAGDYDQDGIQDILAPSHAGFRVVSGREGVQIAHFLPSPTAGGTFRTLALATPHGFPNLLLQRVNGTYLMTSMPRRSQQLGPGCSVGPAASPLLGMRELNGPSRRLTLSGAEPGAIAFLMLGLADNKGPLSLAPFGLPQCTVHPSLQVVGGFTTGATGIDAGFARHDCNSPGSASLGMVLDAQWLTLDSSLGLAGLTAGLQFELR